MCISHACLIYKIYGNPFILSLPKLFFSRGGGGDGHEKKVPKVMKVMKAATEVTNVMKAMKAMKAKTAGDQVMRRPSAASKRPSGKVVEDIDPDGSGSSADKLKLATELANGDSVLAVRALSLKQSDKNRWKGKIENQETCSELKKEWTALGELGHGRNKKRSTGLTSVIFWVSSLCHSLTWLIISSPCRPLFGYTHIRI